MSLALMLLVSLAPQAGDADRWRFHFEEQAIERLWLEVSSQHRPRTVLFEHSNLISMSEDSATSGQLVAEGTSVLVRDGRIVAIGADGELSVPAGALRVDATGKFLMPGLTDMHVHRSTTHAQALLSLANGVTAERELCGFAWELEQRERIREGRLLAPDLFLSGHILNARPMGMYATVVDTPQEARRVVARQVAEGYDFIKVHNTLPLEVYRAICDEARRLGVRVVGHLPSGITLSEGLAQGHHTFEHLKGYILDSGLILTEEDYVSLTDGSGIWNCPTLSTRVIGLTGEEAYAYLDGFEGMSYVPIPARERWYAAAEGRRANNSHARVWELSQGIFRDLLATDARFLAGSDSGGGYENQVPGFMLHEELSLMEELGLSTLETLRAATLYAALALETEELGTVEVGRAAHLLLLDSNPLETVRHLRRPLGVMVRGVWLTRAAIDDYLARIEELYVDGAQGAPLEEPTEAELDRFVAQLFELHTHGFVFMDHALAEIADLLRRRGREEDARWVSRCVARR